MEDRVEEAQPETESNPEGKEGGWLTVMACSILMFWVAGFSTAWGVLQTALLRSGSPTKNATALSFVGTLLNTIGIMFSTLVVALMDRAGCPITPISGVVLFSVGVLASGLVISEDHSVAGLFGTLAILGGAGYCILFTVSNVVPVQFFRRRLGFASGIVKAAGGLGGAILSISVDGLVRRVGVQWTFHILGFMILGTGLPAAWFLRERDCEKQRPKVFQWSTLRLFKCLGFTATFLTGAIGSFALWVPVFFVPLFAESLGYSSTASAGLISGFNIASTVGRLGSGAFCDWIGSFNSLVLMTLLNTVSMLAVWPVSSSLAPLVVFVILIGLSSGAFFVTLPTAAAGLFDVAMGQIAVTVVMTGWSPGNLAGAPIAAALLGSQIDLGNRMDPFYAMIFYSGCCAFLALCCAAVGRFSQSWKPMVCC